MKSKYRVLILLFVSVSILLSSAYLFLPVHFQSLDDRVRDFYFKFRGPEKTSDDIIIIDIDEKSIKELGQWPWERDKLAIILNNLTNKGIGIIGLDIVFSEPDKTSPSLLVKKWGITNKDLPNYDLILSESVANTPTILGYLFDFDIKNTNEAPEIPAIFIERNKPNREFLAQANGVLTNLDIIQKSGYSSGYMNNIPDETGIIRSVPLLIKYDDQIYPSLAFEMYRIASNSKKVIVNYSQAGVENIILGKQEIKSDRFGRMFLNFRGPAKSYKYISAVDIYNNIIDRKSLEGKIALLGTSAYGLMDLRSTPMDNVIAGVELHANMIDNFLNDDMLIKPSWIELLDIASIILIVFIITFIYSRLSLLFLIVVYPVTFIAILSINYYLLFIEHIILNSIFPFISMILSLVGILAVNYLFESRQKDIIKGKFASKVSSSVMDDILNKQDSNTMDGVEKEITVFFSDIRNFTNISESMGDAKLLIRFMNEVMEPMTEIIMNEKGTVDKYIGDAIMAYWNAPLDVEDHADRAVSASLRQLHAVKSLNEKLKTNPDFKNVTKMAEKNNIPILDIGIGLNSGIAIVGEMGSKKRSDYTVIGDAINLGARLESLCKYYNSKLNISDSTKSKLKGKYIYRFLDLVTVKGKEEPIVIWQVHDFDIESSDTFLYGNKDKLLLELDTYHKAIELYKIEKFEKALEIFKELNSLKTKTNLNIYDIYIKRCEHYIDFPPKNFNGVFKHTTKA